MSTSTAQAPIENTEALMPRMAYVGDSALIGTPSHEAPENPAQAILERQNGAKMGGGGEGMEKLLDCMWGCESSRGIKLHGDYINGIPMATGDFQIWLIYHPAVTYECAMDYQCAKKYTESEILARRGWQWTCYAPCLAGIE